MTPNDMMAEIRDANLSYLMLAQQMIRADKATAIFRLGIGKEIADLIEGLPGAEKRLEALSHDAEKARLLTSKGRIERLLARDERNEPMKSASIQMGEIR